MQNIANKTIKTKIWNELAQDILPWKILREREKKKKLKIYFFMFYKFIQ